MKGELIVDTASLACILKGFNRKSVSYYVAKHSVVSLTRSLGQDYLFKMTGVEHRAICPAFAATDINEDLGVNKETMEKKEGFMDPDLLC